VNDPSELEIVAQRILEAAAKPFDLAGAEGRVGARIGIFPDDGTDLDALVKSADAAMYAAKQAGKNTVRFHAKEVAQAA
jgi:GGDEF domain-containing protein